MSTDNSRIDHLQCRVAHPASGERLQDHIPDPTVGPPPKLPKDRIPVAEFLRQVAPRCARSHQPKHRIEHTTMVARWPAAAADQKRFEKRPLIVGHQSANQSCPPPKSSLESTHDSHVNRLSTRPNLGADGEILYSSLHQIFGPGRAVDVDGCRPLIVPGGGHQRTEARGVVVVTMRDEDRADVANVESSLCNPARDSVS